MRIIRLKEVIYSTGLARSTIYRYIGEGTFPKPVSLGDRCVGWVDTEVQEWILARIPKGQAAHGLRHTFASHFIQNGGNILTLQKILGHSSLAMTMRYAHLAPDHLQDALRFGPISENIALL